MSLYDEFGAMLRNWVWDEKLDGIVKEILGLPEERLFSAVLNIRSVAPTALGRGLVNLPEIREYVKGFLREDEFANYALDLDTWDTTKEWDEGHVYRGIMNNSLVIEIGRKFMDTNFWKTNAASIKKQQRALKKIDGVMDG